MHVTRLYFGAKSRQVRQRIRPVHVRAGHDPVRSGLTPLADRFRWSAGDGLHDVVALERRQGGVAKLGARSRSGQSPGDGIHCGWLSVVQPVGMKVHVDDGWSEAVDTRLGLCGIQADRSRYKHEHQCGQPLHEILL